MGIDLNPMTNASACGLVRAARKCWGSGCGGRPVGRERGGGRTPPSSHPMSKIGQRRGGVKGSYCPLMDIFFQRADIGIGDLSAQGSSDVPVAGCVSVVPGDDCYAYAEPGSEEQ